MWLLFLLAPSKPKPEVDGMHNLGEIGHGAGNAVFGSRADRAELKKFPKSPTRKGECRTKF
jgi:hypothetical protein